MRIYNALKRYLDRIRLRFRSILLRFRPMLLDTHPLIYWCFLGFAFASVGLGLNFLFFPPAFNPYGYPKEITGAVFLALGVFQFVVIFLIRKLRLVRFSMAACMVWMLFWGGSTVLSFPRTSFQLPILYALAVWVLWRFLREPYINPLTAKKDEPHV